MSKTNIDYTKQMDKLVSFLMDGIEPYETYKEVEASDGRYFISNRGKALSLCRNEPHILTPYKNGGNYYYVDLMIDGKKQPKRINVLVANAFMEKPEGEGIECHHLDGNPLNNDISNLVFLTKEQHTKAHKILNQKKKETGEKDG